MTGAAESGGVMAMIKMIVGNKKRTDTAISWADFELLTTDVPAA